MEVKSAKTGISIKLQKVTGMQESKNKYKKLTNQKNAITIKTDSRKSNNS